MQSMVVTKLCAKIRLKMKLLHHLGDTATQDAAAHILHMMFASV